MSKSKVVIVNYKTGNLFNVQRAISFLGFESVISCHKDEILSADKIILPGVGSFDEGMKGLEENNLIDTIKEVYLNRTPILGICLGMQLLMTASEEGVIYKGLNLVEGEVKKFIGPNQNDSFRIPHYGWTEISSKKSKSNFFPENSILRDIENEQRFYFVHSFFVDLKNDKYQLASSKYGKNNFTSVIRKKNISACQFHPELSGKLGLKIFDNFLKKKK